MADYDFYNDKTPRQTGMLPINTPTVAALKTALTTFQAATYTAPVLRTMTKRDMVWACRQNGLTVAGLS